jgi:hypothetical protein
MESNIFIRRHGDCGGLKNLESFSLRFLFEKNRFPGDAQKHFGNSGRPIYVCVPFITKLQIRLND